VHPGAVRQFFSERLPTDGITGVPLGCMAMAGIVLRVRLIDGEHLDVRYEEPGTASGEEVTEHVISALASDSGVLRTPPW
jgi:hypothetical protein